MRTCPYTGAVYVYC